MAEYFGIWGGGGSDELKVVNGIRDIPVTDAVPRSSSSETGLAARVYLGFSFLETHVADHIWYHNCD
jgi:hypothetical protein